MLAVHLLNLVWTPALIRQIFLANMKHCKFGWTANLYATFVWCVSELQKLWRGVAVDGMDEGKIEEYLRKQGITSMQDAGLKKVVRLYVIISWHINSLQIID